MCFQHSSDFAKGIIVALWTIIQTCFHVMFVLCGHYSCRFKPSQSLLVIFYITYFYNYDKCGHVYLDSDTSVNHFHNDSRLIDLDTDPKPDEDDLYRILYTILEKGNFPAQSTTYLRTQFYLFLYIFIDGFWMISTFILFAGICFNVKKTLSLFFYGPWLVVCGFHVFLDIIAAVHYGLDMLQIKNYTSWLKFIGIENYKDFSKFNKFDSAVYVPHISSIVMVMFFSRFLIFWLLNIMNFFTITTNCVLAYKGPSNIKRSNETGKSYRSGAHNSTESRIRQWQLFYGNEESTSSMSSASAKSDNDNNFGENIRMSARHRKPSLDSPQPVACVSTTRYSIDSMSSNHSSPKVTSSYLKFPDVIEGWENNQRKGSVDSINHTVPWSYTRFNEKPPTFFGNHGEAVNSNKVKPK
ncbi:uncharacterized protein [Diabrotica undecimpunctata]|uniref:uncharacterized protein n=1 Tax=Diabrotica undecimpunctata TaxID=50387 RepID=UPI003B63AA0D